MKVCLNRVVIVVAAFIVVFLAACQKDISKQEVGNTTVYIPQSLSSGGTNLNYNVPMGFGNTKNYEVDAVNNKVNVFLGASIAGKEKTGAFNINVGIRTDTLTQLISKGATFQILPATAYKLPQTVSFAAGESSVSYNLSIDKTILKTYSGKTVAVCIVISNSTIPSYQISASNNIVIVIIDVDALKLT